MIKAIAKAYSSKGLNPFEFRASFDRLALATIGAGVVLIPLNSGLHLIAVAPLVDKVPVGLNPFEFRASFDRYRLRYWRQRWSLNPFEFRASFDPNATHLNGSCLLVLIPLNSGLHLICLAEVLWVCSGVLIPLNSGLHLIMYLKVKSKTQGRLNPFEFRASFDPSKASPMFWESSS